jgi:hypothetical protein
MTIFPECSTAVRRVTLGWKEKQGVGSCPRGKDKKQCFWHNLTAGHKNPNAEKRNRSHLDTAQ